MTEQDKQALIKHFCERDCGEEFAKECAIMPCHEIELIQEFPTTEPDTDTISRAKAIKAIDEIESEIAEGLGFEYEKWRKHFCDLPPAQPDIIRCRNCKFASGDSRICMKFDHSPIGELDFCAWAERRTDE